MRLLLDSGALCERDTFQGERCLYNALNDRIRNLLLAYDYSKSTDPLQPFAAHITSLLGRPQPDTSDIIVAAADTSFKLHKFVLAARSPYFRNKLSAAPETTSWKLPASTPPQAFEVAIKYLYLGEIPTELGGGPGTGFTEEEVLGGIDKISKHLEIGNLWEHILASDDRRLARQQRTDEVSRGRAQFDVWFKENVLKYKVVVDTDRADSVQWDRDNSIFADVLLRADELPEVDNEGVPNGIRTPQSATNGASIPIGPFSGAEDQVHTTPAKSTLYPCHRAMLIRCEYFMIMFASAFREAQTTPHLQIINVDCSPEVLEAVLTFLYSERTDFGLDIAVDVLYAADLLLIDRLKAKTAQIISTLGNGTMTTTHPQATPHTDPFLPAHSAATQEEDDILDPFGTLRAAWLLRVPRLEEFVARYFAYRLERFIDLPEFEEVVKESAARIRARQETDSIELVDDIRFHLSNRFRLRFEDLGFDELDDGDAGDADAEIANGVNGLRLDDKPGGRNGVETNGVAVEQALMSGQIRTLDGEIAGDEFAAEALNYQLLLGKIDLLLDRLKLDA